MAHHTAGNLLLVIAILDAPMSQAQSPTRHPEFETASIKINTAGGSTFMTSGPQGVAAKNAPLRQLIGMAYRVRDFQISGGPAWIDSDHYDVDAKRRAAPVSAPMTKEAMLKSGAESDLMLQSLLANRFKLRLHREAKELPVYALTVAKGGVRMQRSKEASCTFFDWQRNDPPPGAMPLNHCGAVETGPNIRLNHTLDAVGISITRMYGGGLTDFLSTEVFFAHLAPERLVVDKTGLTGLFDFRLEWSRQSTADPSSSDEFTNPSIFTAVEEQLGLKLEAPEGPVEVLVIDHTQRPSNN